MQKQNDNIKTHKELHASVEQDIPHGEVKTRAVRGVASLFARQGILRVLGFVGMLVLARILTPEMFGVFAIANFVVVFFEEMSSLGLSAALLRKKENVTEIELRTVFTLQQSVVLISLLLIMLFASDIAAHYELDDSYSWLIRVLGISLLLASLKTIPSILLQRQLRHDLLAISEVFEYLVYLSVAIGMAILGYGVWSLVVATLLRGITGVIVLYYISWWKPAFGFHRETAKEILSFGLPMQLGSLSALANNAVVPIVVGSFLGPSAVGMANFAKKLLDALAHQPLILVGKVQLRVFGRVQDDHDELQRLVEKSLHLGSIVIFFMLSLFLSQAELFIDLVVTDKWKAALPLLYIMSIGYMIFALLMPYLQLLKATGDAVTPLITHLLRFAFHVVVFIAFVGSFDLIAYAVAMVVAIVLSTPVVIFRVHKIIRPKIFFNVVPSMIAGIFSALLAHKVGYDLQGYIGMSVGFLVAIILYFMMLGILDGNRVGKEIHNMLTSVNSRSQTLKMLSEIIEVVFIKLNFIKMPV